MNMSIGFVNRALACAFIGLLLGASPGFAQKRPNGTVARSRIRQAQLAPNRYILFLQDEPVASRFASHEQLQTAAAAAYRQQIESRQQSVVRDLATRNVQVAGSVSTVLNAIFVVATPDRVAELRGVAGVVGVMRERIVKRSLNRATTLANAPSAWAQSAIGGQSNAGNGIKIGILDTGIDQTHPAFSDAGFTLPAGFPKCSVPSDCTNYTNKKVIVARSYVPMIDAGSNPANPAVDSLPDDFSARDRDGHGSAVAAVAAAVQNSGGTVPFSGMAPKAYLGSYKIFGSDQVSASPSESILIQALNDAVNDGMDVISMSSGVPAVTGALDDVQCGNAAGVWCDPLAKAFDNAAKAGTVITVSAGNNGDNGDNYQYFNSITSPATAPSVIGVGATVNSHVMNPTVTVNTAGAPASLKSMPAAMSDYYPTVVYGSDTGPLIDVTQLGDNGYACSALPAGSLTDKYVLIQDGGSCSGNFDTKITNAGNAGAIGVVLYMATSAALFNPEGTEYFSCSVFQACPVVMISLSNGQALKTYIDANPGASVTIDTAGSEQVLTSLANTVASYSSFGPTPDGSIKPDMVATGGYDGYLLPDPNDTYLPAPAGMYTVGQNYDPNGELYTTNRYIAADGTSFAAPLVAGAAALVKQAHPTWKAAQIKSALVNNSAQDVTSDDFGDSVDVRWIGAGRLDANAAVLASVTAAPPSLSFGYLKSGVAFPKPIPVTVTNNGTSSVTLAVAVAPGYSTTSATVTTDQKSLTIAAGATATVNVSLTGTVPVGGEYDGAVTLTSASPAASLHLPYMFMVGDGSSPNVIPMYGSGLLGTVGQDLGPMPIQVVDSWGVPVVGSTVTFTVGTRGSATLKPVPGVPGGQTGSEVPFVPSNCSPSSSSTSVTCTTNNYGIAWIEVIGGASPISVNNPATITAAGGGQTIQISVSLEPASVLQNVTDAGAFGPTVAPGSYVSLFGTNLVDANYLANSTGDIVDATLTNGRLPLTWDGVTVSFDAPATGSLPAISVPGYVYFVSTGQVNIYAPWELENYPSAQMKVTSEYGAIRSSVVTVPISNYVPAFLMYNSGSVFIADAVDGVNCPAPYIIGTACPATRGALVSFYVNGLGPVTNQPASGDTALVSPLSHTTTLPVVMIGGQQATVQFAGLAPPYVGLYQVNAYIPTGIGTGNQPITIAIGGKTSPGSITSGSTTYNIVLPVK